MSQEGLQDDSDPGTLSSDGNETSESEPELMITTRERRRTAGNRYSTIVAQEQADEDEEDDVALLFAEAEGEDEEYNSDEADDEADMSSSDDDDQGPNAAADDLEGEKEMQKQAKIERQKKRKADMAMTTLSSIRKKPKVDPTALHRAPDKPKPSKRKERVSWLPTENQAPGRTSLRKQTVAHREITMERLKENEEQRLKNKAIREEKEKIKQAAAPRQMTQADRLAEAEKNERRNAKSLNRWEAMEAKRAEEQAARLAALKDRKLNGPVITFYSSAHTYRGPKIERLSPPPGGSDDFQAKKRGRKAKATQNQTSSLPQRPLQSAPAPVSASASTSATAPAPASASDLKASLQGPATGMPDAPIAPAPNAERPDQAARGDGWLAGIHEYASMQSAPTATHPTSNFSQEDPSLVPQAQQSSAGEDALPLQMKPAVVNEGAEQEDVTKNESITQHRSSGEAEQKSDMQASGEVEPQQQPSGDHEQPSGVEPSHRANTAGDVTPAETDQTKPAADQNPAPSLTSEAGVTTEQPTAELLQVDSKSLAVDTGVGIPAVPPSNPPKPPEVHQAPTTPSNSQLPAVPVNTSSSILPPAPAEEVKRTTPPPVEEVVSTRNLVILEKFEDLAAEAKQAYSVFYGTKRAPKPIKQVTELCAISGLPARYKDPASGVGYANVQAFRKLKGLQKHEFQWSSMLGCYVGRTDRVARGVPPGFLGQ